MINISIDDVSPHPLSSVKVLEQCYRLISVFRDIKFTLFIPMAYTRLNEKSYFLDKYPDFCNTIRRLPKNNFELGWHGYYHGKLGCSGKDEFSSMNYNEALSAIERMKEMAKRVDLLQHIKSIFRPPAFRMSADCFPALKENNISILALSPRKEIRNGYRGQDDEFAKHSKVIYYNSNPPHNELKLFEKTEIVYHACEWTRSYLDKNMADSLIKFLHSCKNPHNFVFMDQL